MNVGVWDCTFYMVDDNGKELTDKDGYVKLFKPNDGFDYSYISESVEVEDLVEYEE
jgi:hypothetical protein